MRAPGLAARSNAKRGGYNQTVARQRLESSPRRCTTHPTSYWGNDSLGNAYRRCFNGQSAMYNGFDEPCVEGEI